MNPSKNLSTSIAFVTAGMLVCCGGLAALRVAVHEEPSRWEWLPQSVATSPRAAELSFEDREYLDGYLDRLSATLKDLTELTVATEARREAALADPALRPLAESPETRDAVLLIRDDEELKRLTDADDLGYARYRLSELREDVARAQDSLRRDSFGPRHLRAVDAAVHRVDDAIAVLARYNSALDSLASHVRRPAPPEDPVLAAKIDTWLGRETKPATPTTPTPPWHWATPSAELFRRTSLITGSDDARYPVVGMEPLRLADPALAGALYDPHRSGSSLAMAAVSVLFLLSVATRMPLQHPEKPAQPQR